MHILCSVSCMHRHEIEEDPPAPTEEQEKLRRLLAITLDRKLHLYFLHCRHELDHKAAINPVEEALENRRRRAGLE